MEFKDFCKERDRMCQYHSGKCKDNACPLFNVKNNNRLHRCDYGSFLEPDEAERIVSEWAKEHPVVTNADKFREVFGIKIDVDGNGDAILDVPCPYTDREWLMQKYQPPRKENTDD